MEYRNLGRSGVKVSTLCLGTMTLGEADSSSMMHGIGTDEATAFELLDASLEAGINFLDTADVYGNDGLSERVIGKWLAQGKRRDDIVLATKCRFRMSPGPNGTGASRYHIRAAVEASLQRLQTDRIDLLQIHCQDNDVPEEETLRALDDLVRAGKVLYTGASNYAAYRLVHSQETAKQHGLAAYSTYQAQYSLIARDLEREHVPACRDYGLGILPWSPLAGGFLAGKYRKGDAPPEGTRYAKWQERLAGFDSARNWAILDTLDAVAKELSAPITAVALAWLIKKPQVTSVIFGARTKAQLADNLAGAALDLPGPLFDRLEKASAIELGYPYDFIARVNRGRW